MLLVIEIWIFQPTTLFLVSGEGFNACHDDGKILSRVCCCRKDNATGSNQRSLVLWSLLDTLTNMETSTSNCLKMNQSGVYSCKIIVYHAAANLYQHLWCTDPSTCWLFDSSLSMTCGLHLYCYNSIPREDRRETTVNGCAANMNWAVRVKPKRFFFSCSYFIHFFNMSFLVYKLNL